MTVLKLKMIRLKKISQIATVDPGIILADYESELNYDGLTGGYRPFQGFEVPLSSCLSSRLSNLYFLKYGSIEELCIGGLVMNPGGKTFRIKTAPRSATGPDLRRLVVGSNNIFGYFTEVTLKVFPMPEHVQWGLALFDSVGRAAVGLRRMLGLFIRPMFARIMDDEEGLLLLRSLNLPEADKVILAFKLSGLKGMVEAESRTIVDIHENDDAGFYWPSKPSEVEMLDETLITPEGLLSLVEKTGAMAGRNPKTGETKAEIRLREYICGGISKPKKHA